MYETQEDFCCSSVGDKSWHLFDSVSWNQKRNIEQVHKACRLCVIGLRYGIYITLDQNWISDLFWVNKSTHSSWICHHHDPADGSEIYSYLNKDNSALWYGQVLFKNLFLGFLGAGNRKESKDDRLEIKV